MGAQNMRVLADVKLEMERQDVLKAQGRFRYHTGDEQMSNAERLAVLVEEVGEVARAVLERERLVQVAAVCCKWLQGMDERER